MKDFHKHFGEGFFSSIQSPLTFTTIILIVVGSSILGLLWAIWNYWGIRSINIQERGYHKKNNEAESVKEIGDKIHEVIFKLI
jgi:hypothetical protein